MLSEVSWMEFFSVSAVLLLFYYLWVLYSFYRAQKRGRIQQDGEPWPPSWSYPKPNYFAAREAADVDYQVHDDAAQAEGNMAAFTNEFRDYLNSLTGNSINVEDVRLHLLSLLQANRELHSPALREQLKEIIEKQGAFVGLNLTEELDLDALWAVLP